MTDCRAGAHMQPFRGKEQRSNLSLALRAMQAQTGMVPFGFAGVADGSIVIDTWAEDVTASSGSGSDTAAGACLGIVPYIAPGQTDADASSDEVRQLTFLLRKSVSPFGNGSRAAP